jgi:hypothetical protein
MVIKGATNQEVCSVYQYFESDKRSSTDVNFKYRRFNNYDDYYWIGASYRFLNDQPGKPLNLGPMLGFQSLNFILDTPIN